MVINTGLTVLSPSMHGSEGYNFSTVILAQDSVIRENIPFLCVHVCVVHACVCMHACAYASMCVRVLWAILLLPLVNKE